MPEALLPVVDRPLIHYAVDEALAAGVNAASDLHGKARPSARSSRALLPGNRPA